MSGMFIAVVVLPKCSCRVGHVVPENGAMPEYYELDNDGIDYYDRAKPAAARFIKLSKDPEVLPAVHLDGKHIISVTLDGKEYK